MDGGPDRWLHLRHPDGFDQARFERFEAYCRVWVKLVDAVVAERRHFSSLERGVIEYVFYPPELSADRTVATLPIGGDSTLGSRAHFENCHWRRVWENFPFEFLLKADEGFTEDVGEGPQTNWRPCLTSE